MRREAGVEFQGERRRFVRKLFWFVWHSLALIGLVSVLGGTYAVYRLVRAYDVPVRQLAVKAAQKFGIFPEAVRVLASPRPRFDTAVLEGRPRSYHPRVIFSGPNEIESLRRRYKTDPAYKKIVDQNASGGGMMASGVAWVCGADFSAGARVVKHLEKAVLETPRAEGSYGNALEYALAYDLAADHPNWTPEARARIHLLSRKNLQEALLVLDGESASLWHGRTQLAASAWVAAAVMDPVSQEDGRLRARVQRHFLESVEAFRQSGGWPEGYNYWVNNRAFPFVLACLAQMNAVEEPSLHRMMSEVLTQVGLWTIHGTEPIGRFVLFGDSGPRNDLKDETQRVVDLVFLGTENPVFRDYSRYLSGLHGEEAYWSGYRWGIPLFRGWWGAEPEGREVLKDLSVLEGRVPRSALFGKDDGMGQVFIRSDWGPEATFIAFMGGHTFTHHGHYQAGHFTVTKKAPLAVTSGTYGGFTSPHRLHYAIRTVAANAILVLRPGEEVRPNRFFEINVADGGQRIVLPTGSAVVSLQDWRNNLYKGRHYEGGVITAYSDADERFVYVASDLTGAYNNTGYDDNGRGGKVEWVRRSLVYLRDHDVLIFCDDVKSVRPEYTKKWLLHSWAKPETLRERVLRGSADNGILESEDPSAMIRHGGASLEVRVFFPESPVLRKVGGPDFRYYVEMDGDDADLDGINMADGADEKPWFDAGLWRLEIQPKAPNRRDRFLIVLTPRLNGQEHAEESTPSRMVLENAVGLRLGRTVIFFPDAESSSGVYSYDLPDSQESFLHLWTNLPPRRLTRVSTDGGQIHQGETTPEGLLAFESPPGPPRRLTLRIE